MPVLIHSALMVGEVLILQQEGTALLCIPLSLVLTSRLARSSPIGQSISSFNLDDASALSIYLLYLHLLLFLFFFSFPYCTRKCKACSGVVFFTQPRYLEATSPKWKTFIEAIAATSCSFPLLLSAADISELQGLPLQGSYIYSPVNLREIIIRLLFAYSLYQIDALMAAAR